MTVRAEDVPDQVLSTLLEEAPLYADLSEVTREQWRSALALTLTAWEGGKPPAYQAHQCHWTLAGVKFINIIGIRQTIVTMLCDSGCGDLKTSQLPGEWTREEILGGRQSLHPVPAAGRLLRRVQRRLPHPLR
jgi:hypothetical protein